MDKKQQNVKQANTLNEYANIAFPRDKTVCMMEFGVCYSLNTTVMTCFVAESYTRKKNTEKYVNIKNNRPVTHKYVHVGVEVNRGF